MGRPLSVLDASVLIALLDEKDVGRPVARSAVDEARRGHDLLIPVTAFSESIVAPYRAAVVTVSVPRPRWSPSKPGGRDPRHRQPSGAAPGDAADQAPGRADPCDGHAGDSRSDPDAGPALARRRFPSSAPRAMNGRFPISDQFGCELVG